MAVRGHFVLPVLFPWNFVLEAFGLDTECYTVISALHQDKRRVISLGSLACVCFFGC